MPTMKKISNIVLFTVMYRTASYVLKHDAKVVDLRSDVLTQPPEGMRRAMCEAEVGDDCFGEDSTVNALQEKAAKLFGKEACLLVVSGTMSNLIATLVHCDGRGLEVIVGDKTHLLQLEQSGVAQLGRVQMTTLKNLPDGTFDLEELRSKIHDDSISSISRTGLICVENTHSSGQAVPLPWLDQLVQIAREANIPLHMDGARIFNAAVCSGVSLAELCKGVTSVSACLNKGLAVPVGTLLLGDRQFINKARRIKRALGGGWRQAGVLAAAGIYALDHMMDKIAVDHARTRAIAEAIVATKTHLINIDLKKTTSNIIFMRFTSKVTNHQFLDRMLTISEEEAKFMSKDDLCIINAFTEENNSIRLVLYCNVSEEYVAAAIKKLQFIIKEFEYKTYDEKTDENQNYLKLLRKA